MNAEELIEHAYAETMKDEPECVRCDFPTSCPTTMKLILRMVAQMMAIDRDMRAPDEVPAELIECWDYYENKGATV